MPTLLDYAGVEYPAEFNGRKIEAMRGRSMAGLLNGSTDSVYGPDELVGGEMGNGKWMRQGPYKAVLVPKPYGTGPAQLETLKTAWNVYAAEVGVVPGE
jgi:arylsulfatase